MKQIDYNKIVKQISSYSSTSFRRIVEKIQKQFESQFSFNTLLSICLIQHQQYTKKTLAEKTTDELINQYYAVFTERLSASQGSSRKSYLLELAEEIQIPPALLSRLVLKKYLFQKFCDKPNESFHLKTELSRMMKNPFEIPDAQMAYEVRQCVIRDGGYGLITDSIRHMVGLEYEEKLVDCVKALSIPYQDETEMRRLGFDKTPDIKLEIPIAVNGQVICWIESKASFGAPQAHKQYLDDQYYSYWNRFGPGLVIYWFGFVDELARETQRQGIILMDNFPASSIISYLEPKLMQASKIASIVT